MGPPDALMESAVQALQRASLQPADARSRGHAIADQARRHRRWDVVSVARRASGVAAMHLRRPDAALADLRLSLSAARRAGSRPLIADARTSLAFAMLMRGRTSAALREIESALDGLTGIPRARALAQRSGILTELGHVGEAMDDLREAVPALRRDSDVEWAVRALSNRSLLHIARRAFAAAEADLAEVRRLCRDNALDLPLAYAEHNLGWLQARRGDIPAALHHFDLAAQRYRRLGMNVGTLLIDRAEVLLSVRLVDEARTAAEDARAELVRQRTAIHVPEAELMLSTVARVEGDTSTAVQAADRAVRGFRALGRREWLVAARYAKLQASAATPATVTPARARRLSGELLAAGWVVPAIEARILAGQLAIRRGDAAGAREDLATTRRARSAGPAEVRARAWLAEATLRLSEGDRRGARAALRAGVRVVNAYQATLGATELRATVSMHRGALSRLGMRMALEASDARRVLLWSELGRASALRTRPVHPPADPQLARLLADLRSTVSELEALRVAGRPSASLDRRQLTLERLIRDHCRESPAALGQQAPRLTGVEQLRPALGAAALVELIEMDGDLHAVTVVEGRVRLHRLGPVAGIQQVMTHLPFALRRLADPRESEQGRVSAVPIVERAATMIEASVMRPLRDDVQDRPLVVVPTGALQGLPWSILPSCAARPVTVSPSAALWWQASRVPAQSPPGNVVVAAGPGLAGARDEAVAVADLYPLATCLFGDGATARGVLAAMEGAHVVHLAAHGRLRADNPLFTALDMVDGPLTVYDIEQLRHPPSRVVLAACDTARSHVVAGEEVIGLAAALLAGGTSALIAPVLPIPDVEASAVMVRLHGYLRDGDPPASALVKARDDVRDDGPVSAAAAGTLVCLGSGL